MVNNLDWTGPMSAIEFLRDVGKHFPVNRMLAREVVKARLETGISFTEFCYQLLQAHDYFELHRRHGCVLQFGGSDQWGNITAGVDYVRRAGARPGARLHHAAGHQGRRHEVRQDARAAPIWLDPEMTCPYAFYQFWFNADDRDVAHYLKVLQLPVAGGDRGARDGDGRRARARAAQQALAEELTALLHGRGDARGDRREPGAVRAGCAGRAVPVHAGRRAGRGRSASRFTELPAVAALLRDSGLVGESRRGPPGDRRGW